MQTNEACRGARPALIAALFELYGIVRKPAALVDKQRSHLLQRCYVLAVGISHLVASSAAGWTENPQHKTPAACSIRFSAFDPLAIWS